LEKTLLDFFANFQYFGLIGAFIAFPF